jgi:hypothetical protein
LRSAGKHELAKAIAVMVNYAPLTEKEEEEKLSSTFVNDGEGDLSTNISEVFIVPGK